MSWQEKTAPLEELTPFTKPNTFVNQQRDRTLMLHRAEAISNCKPSRVSICASRLLMAGVDKSSSQAAPEKFPERASTLKKTISEGADIGDDIVK